MQLSELDTSHRYPATVVASERITPASSSEEVRELILEVDAPSLKLDVGQSVGVLAPGQKDFGQDYHLRLYSVADLPEQTAAGSRIKIAVRRCTYVDVYSGEQYDGVASNYLCDLREGDELTLTGPYGLPFEPPLENDATLILIATSTGIAPFRAFVRHLFERTEFAGTIWLFYGARTGLDAVYLNDERDDFAQYYDRDTFVAFKAFSPRPEWGDAIDWGRTLGDRGEQLWKLLGESKTYVYVAGLPSVIEALDTVIGGLAGSDKVWHRRKAELVAGRRWVELIY